MPKNNPVHEETQATISFETNVGRRGRVTTNVIRFQIPDLVLQRRF